MERKIKYNGVTFQKQRKDRWSRRDIYKGRKGGVEIIMNSDSNLEYWYFLLHMGDKRHNSLWSLPRFDTIEGAMEYATDPKILELFKTTGQVKPPEE